MLLETLAIAGRSAGGKPRWECLAPTTDIALRRAAQEPHLTLACASCTIQTQVDALNGDDSQQHPRRHTMKTWQKPQLIVLVRSKPEEAILTFCKGTTGNAPNQTNVGCWGTGPGSLSMCGACESPAES